MQIGTKGLVTVFGGSGFVGRHVVRALAKRGYRVRVAVRRPDLAGHLQPLGRVGQIHAVQANIRNLPSIVRAVQGADAVVNLVGILHESGRQTFDAVQAFGAGAAARAAKEAGAAHFVQMSAIGASADSDADYARSKAEGERRVLEAFPGATIIRPSVVFGPEDDFFNRFAAMARISPALPLIGGGNTKFQVVYVGDVAEVIARGVDGTLKPGATYEIGGESVATFKELMQLMLQEIGRKRLLVPLPFPIARMKAGVLQYLPGKLLTPDQVEMLKTDNVVSEAAKKAGLTLEGLGIQPTAMENILPEYLWRFRKLGQFQTSPTNTPVQ
ncbi:MAG: complex I NDUFA9 subunit family protein [Rhodobiaceae bacterium]|nr:complex I NDUFA9 subunit family protein [Rhodobiaceae bacterium]MCC0055295.1 complex I NDUFA9 subunit family protein [Rhodobiaceae bacterium]